MDTLTAAVQPRAQCATEISVSQVLDWYARDGIRANTSPTALKERVRIWALFSDLYGHLPIAQCRPFMLLEFVKSQPGLKAANTRRRWVSTLERPFNAAVEVGLIDRNPFAGLRMPMGNQGRDWTDGEYRALLRAATPEMRRIIVFIRFSGVRQELVRELEWLHIDVDCNAIIMHKHKTAWLGHRALKVRLNTVLIKLLFWILRRQRGNQRFVFLNSYGRQWQTSALTKRLRALREKIGLPSSVKWHGGRHMYCTRAILNGTDIATVAELVGHRDVGTTRRYIHLVNQDEHLNRAAELAIGRTPK